MNKHLKTIIKADIAKLNKTLTINTAITGVKYLLF